jgi:hypothetical protein
MVTAELRILRRPEPTDSNIIAEYGTAFKAVIHMKGTSLNTHRKPYSNAGLEPLDSFSFDITDDGASWHVFTVTKAIQKWQHSSRNLHLLQLSVESVLNGKLVSPAQLGFKKENRVHNNRALLVVFSDDGRPKLEVKGKSDKVGKKFERNSASSKREHWINEISSNAGTEQHHHNSRVKRSSNVEQVMKKLNRGSRRRKRKNYCRRKPLFVDFEKLDWGSWVIAPRGYNAYLCEGICRFPLDKHLRPSNHATVQTILNTVDPAAVPPVCCAPNKLSSISMLYIDPENNIVYKKYEGMVVDRCGCS